MMYLKVVISNREKSYSYEPEPPIFRPDGFTVSDLMEEYRANGYNLEDGETVDIYTVEPSGHDLILLACNGNKADAARHENNGAIVWDSIEEYQNNLRDGGFSESSIERAEDLQAGKYSGVGLVPVVVNGKCYLVQFVL